MHDGVVREVCRVRHVPTCSHNLMSLGQLNRRACTYETRGGVLRVKKGGRVMKRGVLEEGNLYSLVGSVVNSGRRVTVEEPSPQQGGEVNMVTAYGPKVEDHGIDKGLDVDDARGIRSDRGRSSEQVVDGCRCGITSTFRPLVDARCSSGGRCIFCRRWVVFVIEVWS